MPSVADAKPKEKSSRYWNVPTTDVYKRQLFLHIQAFELLQFFYGNQLVEFVTGTYFHLSLIHI